MKYTITGAAGFIGSRLVPLLQEDKNRIIEIDCKWSPHTYSYQYDIAEFVPPDLFESDITIHLSADTGVIQSVEKPITNFNHNVKTTMDILWYCKKNNSRFIFASSGAAVGNPSSPYGASKKAIEGYCSAFSESYGMTTACLRFSNVYGPGSAHKNSLVAKFIKHHMTSTEPFYINGDGLQTRDFIYVDDICQGIKLAAESALPKKYNLYSLATGKSTTILDLINLLNETLYIKTGRATKVLHREEQAGEIKNSIIVPETLAVAKEELGFDPKVGLVEGLDKTVDWFLKEWKHD